MGLLEKISKLPNAFMTKDAIIKRDVKNMMAEGLSLQQELNKIKETKVREELKDLQYAKEQSIVIKYKELVYLFDSFRKQNIDNTLTKLTGMVEEKASFWKLLKLPEVDGMAFDSNGLWYDWFEFNTFAIRENYKYKLISENLKNEELELLKKTLNKIDQNNLKPYLKKYLYNKAHKEYKVKKDMFQNHIFGENEFPELNDKEFKLYLFMVDYQLNNPEVKSFLIADIDFIHLNKNRLEYFVKVYKTDIIRVNL